MRHFKRWYLVNMRFEDNLSQSLRVWLGEIKYEAE